MRIVLPISPANLPKFKQTAKILRELGPLDSRHSLHVFTTAGIEREVRQVFSGFPNCTIRATLPAIVRQPPMTANEPFYYVASQMTGPECWFYLTHETLPLCKDWADKLENAHLISGKLFTGRLDYMPMRYTSDGISRIDHGKPYLLEAAVYSGDLGKRVKMSGASMAIHHEIQCRSERSANTNEFNGIISAEWKPWWFHNGSVVITRLLNNDARVANEAGFVIQEMPCGLDIATPQVTGSLNYEDDTKEFLTGEKEIITSSDAVTETAYIDVSVEKEIEALPQANNAIDSILSSFTEPTLPIAKAKVKVRRKTRKKRGKVKKQ